MRLKLFGVLVALFTVFSSVAQSYSSDVELVEKKQNTVVVRTSGIHEKKKDATEMAVKSAFYTYFFVGIPGLNKDKPLLNTAAQTTYKDYMNRFFEGGRYNNFVRSFTEVDKAERLRSKEYKVAVMLEFLNESLIRDLELNKVMAKTAERTSLEETQEEISLPTIMVVPYRREGESFATILQNDFDLRTAVSTVQKGFVEKGVYIVDFEAKFAATQRAMKYEQNTATSFDKELLQNSGADVYVEVDIEKDATPAGTRVGLVLKAKETASGNVLASRQASSNRFRTTAVDQLCRYVIEDIRTPFLQDISTAMAQKIKGGNTVVLHISLANSATIDMDSEIGSAGIPLSDVLRIWVKKNAKNGKFHVQGTNSEKVIFDQIQIPNRAEDGMQMDASDFSLSLYTYLKSQNIACERKVDGNTIYITIIG